MMLIENYYSPKIRNKIFIFTEHYKKQKAKRTQKKSAVLLKLYVRENRKGISIEILLESIEPLNLLELVKRCRFARIIPENR